MLLAKDVMDAQQDVLAYVKQVVSLFVRDALHKTKVPVL